MLTTSAAQSDAEAADNDLSSEAATNTAATDSNATTTPCELPAHTKSLIAHIASLPGFGQTKGRISYVTTSAPKNSLAVAGSDSYPGADVGPTLAELQLPWRRDDTDMGS